jgi:ubiquinone/menaquinone biosynthesis C-methylase UbiE
MLVRALPEAVAIVATDLNQTMLDFAASQPSVGRATWRQADALSLPFEERSFDAAVCQFGMMFFPDKRAGSKSPEARRPFHLQRVGSPRRE